MSFNFVCNSSNLACSNSLETLWNYALYCKLIFNDKFRVLFEGVQKYSWAEWKVDNILALPCRGKCSDSSAVEQKQHWKPKQNQQPPNKKNDQNQQTMSSKNHKHSRQPPHEKKNTAIQIRDRTVQKHKQRLINTTNDTAQQEQKNNDHKIKQQTNQNTRH